MSSSTSLKQTNVEQERTRYRPTQRNQQQVDEHAAIKDNSVHKVVFARDVSDEEKMISLVSLYVDADTKEKQRTFYKELGDFKEYLQSVNERMAKQRISLTDTETYAELQKVYGDFDNDLHRFIDDMKPLTDITQSLFNLRQNGGTRAALEQIKADKEWEIDFNARVAEINAQIEQIRSEIARLKNENIDLSHQKGWFGSVKSEAKASIEKNLATIAESTTALTSLEQTLTELRTESQTRLAQRNDSVDVAHLRSLIDLTSSEHIERQKNLVASGLHFVESGKERFGSIRQHLEKMIGQIEGLGDNNQQMLRVFAMLNEASKQAEIVNQGKRTELQNTPVPESLFERMKLDENRQLLDEHIGNLSTEAVDTMQAYANLASEGQKIINMEAATKKQVDSARIMHSRGISQVASQISVVLTAVNSAAINEAQIQAGDTLKTMAEVTNEVAKSEAIRIATGRDEVNVDMEALIGQLIDLRDTQGEATQITFDTFQRMRDNMNELERIAKDVNETNDEFRSIGAEAVSTTSGNVVEKPTTDNTNTSSPFSLQ